jgi:hypothetical protein
MKTKYKCSYCKSTIYRYASTVRNKNRVFCDTACTGKFQSLYFTGENNPNYKKGLWIKDSKCTCGAPKDARSEKCALCTKKGFPKGGLSAVTDNEIMEVVKLSRSYLKASKRLGISRGYIKKKIDELKLDISHFAPSAYRPISNEQLFSLDNKLRRGTVKNRVIEHSLIPYKCTECGLESVWNEKELKLDLDHINGNPKDNRLNNLRFLCPNCHSQTKTFRGKNAKKRR